MDNISFAFPIANLSFPAKSAEKTMSSEQANFLEAVSESFKGFVSPQPFFVPGGFEKTGLDFWKNKLELNKKDKSFTEGLEEEIKDELISRLQLLSNFFALRDLD